MACGAPLDSSTGSSGLCPAGRHPMDPGWEECPYCRIGDEATVRAPNRRATVVETPARGTAPKPSAGGSGPAPPPVASSQGSGRKTRFMPAGGPDGSGAAAPADDRRIVALLVTYSWRNAGEVFAVREGRNYIGSGADCEIRIASDPQISGRHATLIYRGRDFWIDDEKSMNGTYVDGEVVETRRCMDNYAQIRTGATVWTFIAVERPGAA